MSDVQVQDCVENSTTHHAFKHHFVSKKHEQSLIKLKNGQKNAKKERKKTYSETVYAEANSEDDAASMVEGQLQKSEKNTSGSLDSDQCVQSQIDKRSQSGIKLLLIRLSQFLRASAMLKHVIDIGWTSVRHTLVLYQNG